MLLPLFLPIPILIPILGEWIEKLIAAIQALF